MIDKIEAKSILNKLKSMFDPKAVEGMARYGINPKNNYGVSVTTLRKMAKEIGRVHQLAEQLWSSGIHDARMLACLIDDAEKVSERQMGKWVKDFDSWDICDICCSTLFDKTRFAYQKTTEWTKRKEEFVKRAGFVLMACLCVHDKEAPDEKILKFLPVIKREAGDDRNYVRKAVNWALRHIGKRNLKLNRIAIKAAQEIKKIDSKTARWIASDAIRELRSEAVQKRLRRKSK